ncbi:MAG TPA: MFS transporter [Nevskiaceae bacterium]|nr:MFS transporter [Nevskiaceae bacterium]
MAATTPLSTGFNARTALAFVVAFGIVSLFADMTYEGMRSVTGPYLAELGANGFIVGLVAGIGELLGYTLRLASGTWADHSRAYWPITLAGYTVQMAAVPLLALTHSWPAAAAFIILERIGKATRKPATDLMLSRAGEHIGQGWAFGLRELLDQCGATIGPLIAALVLVLHHDYRLAFAWLAVPACITLVLVFSLRTRYTYAGRLPVREGKVAANGPYGHAFAWYCTGAALVGFGFADYALIAYHFARSHTVAMAWVPILYAISMAAAGLGSVVIGKLFDRHGLRVLVPATIGAAVFAPLVFLGHFYAAVAGMVVWGLGLGVHEATMSAAVAHLVPVSRRARAYGLFTAIFGLAWFAGSASLGALYDVSLNAVVIASMAAQVLAALPIALAARSWQRSAP